MDDTQKRIYTYAVIGVQSLIAVLSIAIVGIMYLKSEPIPTELQTLAAMIIAFYFGKQTNLPTNNTTVLSTSHSEPKQP